MDMADEFDHEGPTVAAPVPPGSKDVMQSEEDYQDALLDDFE
jgi:hypothetical protein